MFAGGIPAGLPFPDAEAGSGQLLAQIFFDHTKTGARVGMTFQIPDCWMDQDEEPLWHQYAVEFPPARDWRQVPAANGDSERTIGQGVEIEVHYPAGQGESGSGGGGLRQSESGGGNINEGDFQTMSGQEECVSATATGKVECRSLRGDLSEDFGQKRIGGTDFFDCPPAIAGLPFLSVGLTHNAVSVAAAPRRDRLAGRDISAR